MSIKYEGSNSLFRCVCLSAMCLLFTYQQVPGQTATNHSFVISPEQIVGETLKHSYSIKAIEQDIEGAEARSKQAKAQVLPRLSADARATQYAGLKDSAFGPAFSIPAIESRYGAGISINQPLYTGGKLSNQKNAAEAQKKSIQKNREVVESGQILQALLAYWTWSKAYYSGASLEAAVARMERHAQDMANLHASGLATENDKLATEVLLEQTRLQRENAAHRLQLSLARIQLLSGMELSCDNVPLQAVVNTNLMRLDQARLYSTALTNRMELSAAQDDLQALQATKQIHRADLLPQFSLIARYENARPNIMNIPPQDQWDDDVFAGMAMSWNLFDWGLTRAKVNEANTRSLKARIMIAQLQEQILYEIREARIALSTAGQRLEVAGRAEASARRNLETATSLWQNGLNRHLEVLDAHAKLTQAEFETISAKADYLLAQVSLSHAIGTLTWDQYLRQPKADPSSANR